MPSQTPKIRITYREAEGHRTVAVTGAHGGLTPTGHIQASLYHERVKKPESVVRDQESGDETVEGGMSDVVLLERIVEFSVLLRADIARSLGKWLVDQADLFEEKKIEGHSNAETARNE